MNVWRRPGRRAAAAPTWPRVGDGVKRGGSPVRAAMVPVRPNPGGTGVGERRKLGVGCDVDGGEEGAVGGDGAATNGAGSDSISSGRSHGLLYPLHKDPARCFGNRRRRRRCDRDRRGNHNWSCSHTAARVMAAATNPSPASAGSPARPPHRSTKKIAKPACALMAREAENGIHDPMKGSLCRVEWKQLVAVLRRRKSMLYYYGHEISYTG
ncbi:uncharacterized protein LOC127757443 isoform X2 [Oryza glaberrima]|uniref:uncharacterized protein LOC127757443 isoform X2 n=2 Tax=Oryza glaberrima TaxID=4538 RepID=UPI00224C34D3|nr:uncharacterized protein LOC127757443 isoform X2 [Oryza glaberrima]